MGVGFRASEGRKGDLGALGAKHVIELVDELGVAIMDGKLDRSFELVHLPAQVSGLLSDPGGVGMGGAVGVENAAAADLQQDEHVESPKQHRVDGEKVAGSLRRGRREIAHKSDHPGEEPEVRDDGEALRGWYWPRPGSRV